MKGYTEGVIYPGLLCCEITSILDHVRCGGGLSRLDFDEKLDVEEMRAFGARDFYGMYALRSLINYMGDNHIGKVIVPSPRGAKPLPLLFPIDPESGPPPPTRTKADIAAFVAAADNTITTDELVDDIQHEVEVSIKLGDVDGFETKTAKIKNMIDNEPKGWLEFVRLMRFVIDRHIGDTIEQGSQGCHPWPRRSL